MSKIDFLKEQIIEARTFVNRLMSELPEDLWYVIPEGTDSNFIWQVGHLLVSQNFHTLTAVTGVNEKVGRLVPIQKYNRIFNGMGTLHRSIEEGLIPVAELREQTEIIHQICIENLETLNDDVLAECLQPLPFKHPVAETKYEALSWSFKHEMWHSAEMEAIKKRVGVSNRLDGGINIRLYYLIFMSLKAMLYDCQSYALRMLKHSFKVHYT